MLIGEISASLAPGSALVFDHRTEQTDAASERTAALAQAAGEPMQARYSPDVLTRLLERCGLLIYEHLNASEMAAQYFPTDSGMTAPEDTAYLLAVRNPMRSNSCNL